MIAIETKYSGPTNTRGSRIVAFTCNGHRLSMHYDDGKNAEENHRYVAMQLMKKMAWDNYEIVTGGTKTGYCHIMLDKREVQS